VIIIYKIYETEKDIIKMSQNHIAKKTLNNFLKKEINLYENKNIKLYFFDPFEYFCENEKCIQVNNGNLIYNDATHLSIYGSNYLIKKIENSLLNILENKL